MSAPMGGLEGSEGPIQNLEMARKYSRNSPHVSPQVLRSQAALLVFHFRDFLCLFIVLCWEMFCCKGRGERGRKLVEMRLFPLGGTGTIQGIVNS